MNKNSYDYIVADWIFTKDNIIKGSIENVDLIIKDNSIKNNNLEMKQNGNSEVNLNINWGYDYLEFNNNKNKGVYFKTIKDSYINSLEFKDGYSIELILEISRDYDPWMGILTREGTGKEIGKIEGEPEILATLSYNDAFQWTLYPLNTKSNFTNWSMNVTNENSRDGFHHLAIINDGKHTKMYLNGIEELRNPSEELVGICQVKNKDWLIGASMWNNKIESLFSGKLKRIRISDRALNENLWIVTNHSPTVSLIGTNKNSILMKNNDNYTFAVIPDSQYMGESNPNMLTEINKWISYNKDNLNINMVMHVGDISENSTEVEFKNADDYFKILDKSSCNYMTTLGNHDYFDEGKNYKKYFGKKRYENKIGFNEDSFYKLNMYRTIEAGSYEYLFISLDYKNIEESINWARQIIDKNKDKPTIIFTHDSYYYQRDSFIRTKNGTKIWNELVNDNNTIFMVICGHEFGVSHNVSYNKYNNEVIEMLVNYQDYPYGGNGWIRLLEIDEDKGIYARTISPWVNTIPLDRRKSYDLLFLNSDKDEFFINLNLHKRFQSTNKNQ